ncbi:7910_t:CDS:1, partial [Gigaspora margarita]
FYLPCDLESLSLYIHGLILKTHEYGKEIPAIAFEICILEYMSNQDKKLHHIIPTQLALYNCLKLASLQYTVVRQLDVIKVVKMFENINALRNFFYEFEGFHAMQAFWEDNLIRNHFHYQS